MERYVIVDTETSGLFDFSKPADAEGQPRLAEIALIDLDADLNEERRYREFIKPDGWVIDRSAAAPGRELPHAYTTEMLLERGVPVADALIEYAARVAEDRVVVAFNAQYDTKIMRGEFRRAGRDDLFEKTRNICTMRALTGVCKIPRASGSGYKFPKLIEAYRHWFPHGEPPDLHSAMGDAEACLAIFRKMRQHALVPEPAVHYAKEKPTAPAKGAPF